MLLLPFNSSSMGHSNVVGDMMGGEYMEVDLCLEICDVFVEGDSWFDYIVGKLQRDALSFVEGVSRSSRFRILVEMFDCGDIVE